MYIEWNPNIINRIPPTTLTVFSDILSEMYLPPNIASKVQHI